MAVQTLQVIGNDLVNYTLTPVSPAGDLVPDTDGDTFIIAKNTSGANAIVITATAVKACDQGEIHTKTFTVPISDEVMIPLNSRYNNTSGQVAITYDNSRTTAATGIVTFSGAVSDGDWVNIGGRKYEFKTSGSATAGNIKVDVSGGATAPAAVTALVTAVTADTNAVATVADGALDTVDVTAKTTYSGAAGNLLVFTKSGANIAVDGAGTLTNGADVLSIACLRNTR